MAHPYARTRNNENPRTSDMTPMQFAAAFADPATLEVFIDRGHCINGRLEDFEYHGDIGESTDTILTAIDFNNVRNTLHLIERGADYTLSVSFKVCNIEQQGGMPMEFDVMGCCAWSNSVQTLAALIDAGYVEANGIDSMVCPGLGVFKDFMTIPPIIAAAMFGSVGCVYALARRGANMGAQINIDDLSMYSRSSLCALEIAAHNDDTAMMMALVECGAKGMEEALDIASLRRSDSSVNMLLALGANIQDTLRYHIRMNDMDSFRYIAKMGSTYDNHIEVVVDTVLGHTLTLADDRMLQRKRRAEVESTLQASRDYNIVTQERVQDAYQRLAVEKASKISLQTQLQAAQNELQGAKLELESEIGRAQVLATRECGTRQELGDTKEQLEMVERKHAVLQKTNTKQAKTQAFLKKENARLTVSLKAVEEPVPLQHPECVICLDEVTRDMAVGVLPCMHVFCVRCLEGMSDAPYILKRDACCPFKCDLPELGLMRRWQKIHFA